MNAETEALIVENLNIVSRVVGREMSKGVMPWVDRSDMEDVAQLALVKAAAKFRPGRCPFGAFAYREVHAAVLKELRALEVRNRGRAQMPEDVDRQAPAGAEMGTYAALAALPAQEYRAVMLLFWGNLTQGEIALEMGVSQSTVCRILESAKNNLKSCINPEVQGHIHMRGEKSQAA